MEEATSNVIKYGLQNIGLNSIKAYSHVDNKSSIKLLEKLKFQKHDFSDDNIVMHHLKRAEFPFHNFKARIFPD